MDCQSVGIELACANLGVKPGEYQFRKGAASVQDEGVIGRSIAKIANEVMCFCGRGWTAPARHLEMISKSAAWFPQHQEAVNTVLRALIATQAFQKQAVHVADIIGGTGSLAKGIGYGAAIGGSGLGSLYWLLSRHSRQDDADIDAMTREKDYYTQLSGEIEDAMKRKYNYNAQKPKRKSYRPGAGSAAGI